MVTNLWRQYAASESLKHKVALRDHSQGDVFTWCQLAEKIDEIAFRLQQESQTGSGIALYGKNSLQLLCHYLAALQLNMRVLGINSAFTAEKAEQLCRLNDIDLCVSFVQDKPTYKKQSQNRPHFLSQGLTMTLTSGSSGAPKAVVHNIEAHLANARGVCDLLQFTAQDAWLLSLPLYHVSGQGIVWRWLLQGAELHLPHQDFYSSVIRASHISLVPTQLQRLLAYLQQNDIRDYETRHILLGGAQIPTELTRRLQSYRIQSYCGYGMTEMASTVFAKCSDEKSGVGQPLLGREYCLSDDEIWLRGAGLGLGYWHDGRILPFVNEQGWFQTRDKGYWLDNELVIAGRLDNMFISGGENIQPEEIERLICDSGWVEQAFVLPCEDTEFGQRPVAMVKFKQDFSLDAVNKLQNWLSDKIEKFKQPIRYFPLETEKWQQGAIKISRALLQAELNKILGIKSV